MDVFLYILAIVPFMWIFIFMQQKLGQLKYFIPCLLVSLLVSMIGILFTKQLGFENPGPFYLGSQVALSFVVIYSLYRIPYFYFFKREPEMTYGMTYFVDILSVIIVLGGTIALPILLDTLFFHVITKI